MIECAFDAFVGISSGDIISITRGIVEAPNKIRVTRFKNLSKGSPHISNINGILMTQKKEDFDPPIVGKISEITYGDPTMVEFKLLQTRSIPAFDQGYSDIRVFISSDMNELGSEREKVALAICECDATPIYFERFTPDEKPADVKMIEELVNCHIYIGIFATEYSEGTIKEFYKAKELDIPRSIYVKKTLDKRSDDLDNFIKTLQGPNGLTYKKFENPSDLKILIKEHLPEKIKELFIE